MSLTRRIERRAVAHREPDCGDAAARRARQNEMRWARFAPALRAPADKALPTLRFDVTGICAAGRSRGYWARPLAAPHMRRQRVNEMIEHQPDALRRAQVLVHRDPDLQLERDQSPPDKAAQVLLTVIAKDPDAVARALES